VEKFCYLRAWKYRITSQTVEGVRVGERGENCPKASRFRGHITANASTSEGPYKVNQQ